MKHYRRSVLPPWERCRIGLGPASRKPSAKCASSIQYAIVSLCDIDSDLTPAILDASQVALGVPGERGEAVKRQPRRSPRIAEIMPEAAVQLLALRRIDSPLIRST
jgi:hypothetical protein